MTITSSLRSDMTAVGPHGPTIFPCRDPISGIRRELDLVNAGAPFKEGTETLR